MQSKPDDRRDNVRKIKEHIDNTIHNTELANEMISITDDEKTKKALKEKNARREQSLDSMKKELKDEANQ